MGSGLEHEVQENPYSVTLRRASRKGLPRTVRVESLLEYDFYCVLDFDARVETYKEQPVVIPWRTPEGQSRRYTPDVLVKFGPSPHDENASHLRSTIFEIKPYSVLVANWQKLRPKVRGIQHSLEGTYVPFKIVTDRQLRPAFVKNVKFLLNYDINHMVHKGQMSTSQYNRNVLVAHNIPVSDSTTPMEILDNTDKDPEERKFLVPWIWHKLRTGDLQADLIEPLTMHTEVWSTRCEHPEPKWRTREYDWYR